MIDPAAASFCERHWRMVRAAPGANVIVATVEVLSRFVDKVCAERGAALSTFQLNAALEELGPPCCYLGDDVVGELIVVASAVGSGVRA